MDLLGDLLELIGFIAEFIGEMLSVSVEENMQEKHSPKRTVISVIVGIISWAVIIAGGVFSYFLFEYVHPVAGLVLAAVTVFLIALYIAVIIKLIKLKKRK